MHLDVLKQRNPVRLGGLLQRENRRALEAKVVFEVLRNFTDEALEGQLFDQQVRRLLKLANLTQRHGPRPVAVRL
jgi:hypothetical protein